jgi:hypothetical protein
MNTAYSLSDRVTLEAEGVFYRENLDNQLVCPECFEPVFKKELWVDSKQKTTHFFSHYAGKFDSCSLRTSDDGESLNDFQGISQKQRLKIFNLEFREKIKSSLKKSIKSKRFEDAIEYAERISESDSKIKSVDFLAQKMINLLGDPIDVSIHPKLAQLEKAILPLYGHLQSKYGYKNLKFLSCISLISVLHGEFHIFEDMLKTKYQSKKYFFDHVFLGEGVLLLASYINWQGSLVEVEKFISSNRSKTTFIEKLIDEKKDLKNKKATQPSFVISKSKVMGYMECPNCHTYLYLPSSSWCLCSVCDQKFYSADAKHAKSHNPVGKQISQNLPVTTGVFSSMVGDLIQRSEKTINKSKSSLPPIKKDLSVKKRGFMLRNCPKCNRAYFEGKLSICPHSEAQYSYPY